MAAVGGMIAPALVYAAVDAAARWRPAGAGIDFTVSLLISEVSFGDDTPGTRV